MRFPFVKKTINTLLVTCIMIIKLSHYILMLPKTSTNVKSYDGQTKCFLIEDNDLLGTYYYLYYLG